MIKTKLEGGQSGNLARVTKAGQLVTAPVSYDDTKFNELAADDTAYSFYPPKDGKQFVITGIIAYADKQVGTTTGATVIVYEADTDATLTVDKTLFQIEIPQQGQVTLLPLNILVNKGKFINGKTDDDDVHMTITGYYINNLT